MKNYKDFNHLFESEKELLMKYAHTVRGELWEGAEDEYQAIFYVVKPNIYVCVTDETNEDNMKKILSENGESE